MEDPHEKSSLQPADVARRATVLKHLQVHALTVPPRSILDGALSKVSPSERDQFLGTVAERHQGLLAALRRTGLWEDAGLNERRVFGVHPADVEEKDRINASWRAESLGCLAWCLSVVRDLPPYDTQFKPEEVLPLIPDTVADFAQKASLRDRSVIEAARNLAELWHWRSRTRQLQEKGYLAKDGQPSLTDIVAMVAERAAADSLFRPIDGDFPAFGKAYRALSADEWSQVQSIAMERHFALNWICGLAPDNEWEETPTDT